MQQAVLRVDEYVERQNRQRELQRRWQADSIEEPPAALVAQHGPCNPDNREQRPNQDGTEHGQGGVAEPA